MVVRLRPCMIMSTPPLHPPAAAQRRRATGTSRTASTGRTSSPRGRASDPWSEIPRKWTRRGRRRVCAFIVGAVHWLDFTASLLVVYLSGGESKSINWLQSFMGAGLFIGWTSQLVYWLGDDVSQSTGFSHLWWLGCSLAGLHS